MPPQGHAADPVPRLVAHIDGGLLDYVRGVAHKQGTISLPLVSPPEEGLIHVLEIHAPGYDEPLIVLAIAAGPPTPAGYPLRLHVAPSRADPAPAMESDGAAAEPARLVGQTLGGGKLMIEACVG